MKPFVPALVPLLLALAACAGETPEASRAAPPASLPESFHLAQAPAGAVGVGDLRAGVRSGEEIVVTGRVRDFTEGFAAFTVADLSLRSCADMGVEEMPDACQTPWDYCCEDPRALQAGTAVVEFHADGKPIPGTVEGFHGLDHLSRVTVQGRFEKDEAGNLLVVAQGIHVDRP